MSEFPKKSEQPAHREKSSYEIDEQARSLLRDERGLEDWERAVSESNLDFIKRDWPEWSLEDVQRVLKQVGRLHDRGPRLEKQEVSGSNPFVPNQKTITLPTQPTARELALLADLESTKSKTLLSGIRSAIKDTKESAPDPAKKNKKTKRPAVSESARAAEKIASIEAEEEEGGEIKFTKEFLKEVRKHWGNPDAITQAAIDETFEHENHFGFDHDSQVYNAKRIGIIVGLTAKGKPEAFLKMFKKAVAEW